MRDRRGTLSETRRFVVRRACSAAIGALAPALVSSLLQPLPFTTGHPPATGLDMSAASIVGASLCTRCKAREPPVRASRPAIARLRTYPIHASKTNNQVHCVFNAATSTAGESQTTRLTWSCDLVSRNKRLESLATKTCHSCCCFYADL